MRWTARTSWESFWGTKGSENAEDSITVTFKDGAQTIDDVRLYFYQTSSSQTITGYKEPSVYTLEYQDESGEWKALPNQVRTPTYAGRELQPLIQFDPVTATAIRATFTPQAGPGHRSEVDPGVQHRHRADRRTDQPGSEHRRVRRQQHLVRR